MQMQIGTFVFQAPREYRELQRRSGRRWMRRERRGRPPALDDVGRQAEEITLRGTVWVRTADDLAALDALREVAALDAGGDEPVSLPVYLGGGGGASGTFLGHWAVTRMQVTERDLRFDSVPARIDFTVSLIEDDGAAGGALAP